MAFLNRALASLPVLLLIWARAIGIVPGPGVEVQVDVPYGPSWEKQAIEKQLESLLAVTDSVDERVDAGSYLKTKMSIGRILLILSRTREAKAIFAEVVGRARTANLADIRISAECESLLIELNQGSISFNDEKQFLALRKSAKNDLVSNRTKAFVAFTVAEYFYYKNEIGEALRYYEASLELSLSEIDKSAEARYRLYLGYAYLAADRYDDGVTQFGYSLEISSRNGDLRGKAFALIAFGFAHTQVDNKHKALEVYKAAQSIFPEGIDFVEYARLYNGLAKVYADYGNTAWALVHRKVAFGAFQKADHLLGQAMTLPILGSLSFKAERFDDAAQYYTEALALNERTKNEYGAACVRTELGTYYSRLGDFERAELNYEKALRYFRVSGENYLAALTQTRLANIRIRQGRLKDARELVTIALKTNREVRNRFAEAVNLLQVAELEVKEQRLESAYEYILESISLSEMLSADVDNRVLRESFGAEAYERYSLLAGILMSQFERTGERAYMFKALQASERLRSRSMIDALTVSIAAYGAEIDVDLRKKEIELLGSLNKETDSLSLLLRQNADAERVASSEKTIVEQNRALDEVKAELIRSSPVYAQARYPESFDAREVFPNNVDDTTAIVEFLLAEPHSYLWIATSSGIDSFVLPSRNVLEAHVDSVSLSLAPNEGASGESMEDHLLQNALLELQYKNHAKALSRDLFGQASEKLKGKRLIIVADGRLQYLPIGALPWPGDESNEPILVTNEVVYAPSASVLQLIRSQERKEKPKKDLLVFADPVFSKDDTRLTGLDVEAGRFDSFLGMLRSGRSLDQLARLQESDAEAKAITRTVGGFATDVRTGFAANRENVLNADLGDYKMLHFATHGLIEENRPELSGIVLSLYDEMGKQNDGGFIRLQDVYGMNLKSDLVVLSACDTGIGKEVRGEGLLSLTNAFLQAGSKTVVSSLWKVDDAATRVLMTELYRGMADDGLTVSAALRQAQLKLYNDPRYKSPFYWAAFTVNGDYDRVPQISSRFRRYVPYAAVCMTLLFLIYLWRVARSLRT